MELFQSPSHPQRVLRIIQPPDYFRFLVIVVVQRMQEMAPLFQDSLLIVGVVEGNRYLFIMGRFLHQISRTNYQVDRTVAAILGYAREGGTDNVIGYGGFEGEAIP